MENITNQVNEEAPDNAQYIEALEQLRANSVEKNRYEALKSENKRLLDTLINGGTIEPPNVKEETDIAGTRAALFKINGNLSNLEFAQKAIELREAIMERGGVDPFLPDGKIIKPTLEDVQKANKVAEVIKHCIDYADGNSELFTQELMRNTNDAMPIRRSM